MRGSTHALAGALIGVALTGRGSLDVTALATVAGAVGALLPDLDHPRAALSRRVGIVSAPVRLFFGHRGATHGLAAVFTAFALSLCLVPDLRLYGLAAALGYASHVALDGLTVQGVPLLWPSRRRWRLLRLTTGGIIERLFAAGMVAGVLLLAVKWL